jgi:hypothetical protein
LHLPPPISPLALARSLFDGRGQGFDKDVILDESRATRDERPSQDFFARGAALPFDRR